MAHKAQRRTSTPCRYFPPIALLTKGKGADGDPYWLSAMPGSVKNSGHETKPDVLNSECSGRHVLKSADEKR